MSESNDYKLLKKNMPEGKDRLDRIENVVVDGMPDVNFCSEGVECWIEQKSPKEPKRSTTTLFGSNHKISQHQMNWFKRQSSAEGNAYFLIVTDKRWMLIDGAFGDKINSLTVDQLLAISIWHTDKPIKRKEEWKKLRMVLKSANSKRNHTSTK